MANALVRVARDPGDGGGRIFVHEPLPAPLV